MNTENTDVKLEEIRFEDEFLQNNEKARAIAVDILNFLDIEIFPEIKRFKLETPNISHQNRDSMIFIYKEFIFKIRTSVETRIYNAIGNSEFSNSEKMGIIIFIMKHFDREISDLEEILRYCRPRKYSRRRFTTVDEIVDRQNFDPESGKTKLELAIDEARDSFEIPLDRIFKK